MDTRLYPLATDEQISNVIRGDAMIYVGERILDRAGYYGIYADDTGRIPIEISWEQIANNSIFEYLAK